MSESKHAQVVGTIRKTTKEGRAGGWGRRDIKFRIHQLALHFRSRERNSQSLPMTKKKAMYNFVVLP